MSPARALPDDEPEIEPMSHTEAEPLPDTDAFVAESERVEKRTRELVFQAADRMLQAGDGGKISQGSIRAAIGRGSMGTIHPALRDWWASLGRRVVHESRSPEIPEPVSALMAQLWREALAASGAAFDAERAQLAERERDARLRVGELEQSLAAERASAEAAAGAAQAERERLEAALDERKTECTRLEVQAQAARTSLEAMTAERERERVAQREAIEAERTERLRERDRNEREEKRLLAEVDKARQETRSSQAFAPRATTLTPISR